METPLKHCPGCDLDKPVTEFYASGRPHADGTPSYSGRCKPCCIAAGNARWEASAAEREAEAARKDELARLASMAPTRVCRACGEEKPVTGFYVKRVLQSGAIRYRPECRACAALKLAADAEKTEQSKVRAAEWRAEDPERARESQHNNHLNNGHKFKAQKSLRRQDPETRPTVLDVGRASYRKNRETHLACSIRWARANPEAYAAYHKQWWKNHPEDAAAYRATRRARKASAEGRHTGDDIRAIRDDQADLCANPYCKVHLNGRGSVDHIIALVNGGSNWPENLQLLCKPCNSKKRSRDNAVFLRAYAAEKGIDLPPVEGEEDV